MNFALLAGFSSNRPTGPIQSSSRDVRVSVCVCVCPFSCGRFWGLFCPHFPKSDVKFLEIQNPWGKVLERSGLRIEHFFGKWSKIAAWFFLKADFVLQNMVETTLLDGLKTSGRRVYR